MFQTKISETEYKAAKHSVAWHDLSSVGKIEMRGADALDLLNRLSTNELKNLAPGAGSETILTNEKGRIVDVLTILPQENFVLVLCSEGNAPAVQKWLKKYTIMDDVRTKDVSTEYSVLEILGPQAASFISQALGVSSENFPLYQSKKISFLDEEIILTRKNSFSELSFLLIAPGSAKEKISSALENYFSQIDNEIYEVLRVEAGAGKFGVELTDEHNPLEAGLLHLINFKKGCYIGQEVIARLDSYNKVKQRIVGLKSEKFLPETAQIIVDGQVHGKVTSTIFSPALDSPLSLGYLRTEFAQTGAIVAVRHNEENFSAEIVKLSV